MLAPRRAPLPLTPTESAAESLPPASWHILNLMVGDVMVFRGDILHNGLGYPREHLRIHAYLYPPGYDHPSEVHFERASPTAPGAL